MKESEHVRLELNLPAGLVRRLTALAIQARVSPDLATAGLLVRGLGHREPRKTAMTEAKLELARRRAVELRRTLTAAGWLPQQGA